MCSDVKTLLLVPQCYDHLTQWDRLESAATASWATGTGHGATGTGHRATGSVDLLKIWDDTYYEVLPLPQLSVYPGWWFWSSLTWESNMLGCITPEIVKMYRVKICSNISISGVRNGNATESSHGLHN